MFYTEQDATLLRGCLTGILRCLLRAADFSGAKHPADEGLQAGDEACCPGRTPGVCALAQPRGDFRLGLPRFAKPLGPLVRGPA
jgi:hypothetical protein